MLLQTAVSPVAVRKFDSSGISSDGQGQISIIKRSDQRYSTRNLSEATVVM